MIGSSGARVRSAHGARLTVTPRAASRSPSAAATAVVNSGSSAAPRASGPGTNDPVATSRRVTSPPSSSIPMTTPSRSKRSWAVSWATYSSSTTLRPNRITPPRPSAIRRRSLSGGDVPAKPGSRTDSASFSGEGNGYPFTAPAVMPDTSLRCTRMKNTSAGMA
jgi:hypothetical protein